MNEKALNQIYISPLPRSHRSRGNLCSSAAALWDAMEL